MSARIPHLLTRLLTESECDALREEMLARANSTKSRTASLAWIEAADLLRLRQIESLDRRTSQTPSARRKSLSYRP